MPARRMEVRITQLRNTVELCRRLAQGAVPAGVVEELEALAPEYEHEASDLSETRAQMRRRSA